MNPLRASFEQSQRDGRKVLLPYITAGYPDLVTTVEILKRVDARRCACVELGIPFSDPIADGPVIQTSFSRALERGFRVDALWRALRHNRHQIGVPLVAMVSFSIVYRRAAPAFALDTPPGAKPRSRDAAGPPSADAACQGFVEAAADAGINALIVPDLSIEEAHELANVCRAADCPLTMIVAPTTDPRRLARIVALSEPFIYYQSLAGVTGERARLAADLAGHVADLRRQTDKPVCVGFGISTPKQVAEVCRLADGAIVGSAIVRRMNQALDAGRTREELVDCVVGFIDELAAALPVHDCGA